MKTCHKVIITAGVSLIGALLCYVGYVVYKKDHDGSDKPPHIILIVADDLGWNDVSFHGANEIPTPNIDALAYNGVILNRHYVLPSGSSSRWSLMTGRYAIRDGLQGVPTGKNVYPRGVPLNVTFMPQYLRDLGYEAHLLGKWDIGYYTQNHTPIRRGFETFFGFYNGLISYFNNATDQQVKDELAVTGFDLHRDGPNGFTVEYNNSEYFTDMITDEAEKIIKNNANKWQLFLEIAHFATHATISMKTPLEVRNVTENDERFAYIKDEKRRRYAGVMQALDESVGRVVKALSDADMLDNSIIIFMSDNGSPTVGHTANTGSNYPLRGVKGTLFEGGLRSTACVFSPLIKKSQKLSEKYVHMTDWLPTLYSAAGGNISDLGVIDGVDQWESFVNDLASLRHNILLNINELEGDEAAIVGKFKIIKTANKSIDGYFGDSGNSPLYPLYNVSEALNSSAGLAISQLPGFFSSTEDEAQQLRESAIVSCRRPSKYSNCNGTCLFDIVDDPCETQDLSKLRAQDVIALNTFIDQYRKVLVSQLIPKASPCSCSQHFNSTHVPLKKKDNGNNSSTIIPKLFPQNNASNENTKNNTQSHKSSFFNIF